MSDAPAPPADAPALKRTVREGEAVDFGDYEVVYQRPKKSGKGKTKGRRLVVSIRRKSGVPANVPIDAQQITG